MNGIISLMKETGLPFAYDHFAEGDSPEPPFICFLTEGSDNFSADGSVFLKVSEVHLELYTDKKDPETERKVEEVLDRHNVFYNKSEVWIETEKLFEVLYIFEMEESQIWETK